MSKLLCMSRTVLLALALVVAVIAPVQPASASHGDGTYDQPVWFEWNAKTIDALIVPADHGQVFNGNGLMGGDPVAEAGPCTNSYTRAMAQSARDWKTAIDAYGPAWLQAVVLNVYVLGCDAPPPTAALRDPEIVVAADENKTFILGISFSSNPCLALNSKMFIESFTYNDMYSVAGHEFGHCMGLQHVNDEHPDADILDASIDESIGDAGNPRHCPSNLNVSTLKGVFAAAFGQSGAGVAGSVRTSAYQQIAC